MHWIIQCWFIQFSVRFCIR